MSSKVAIALGKYFSISEQLFPWLAPRSTTQPKKNAKPSEIITTGAMPMPVPPTTLLNQIDDVPTSLRVHGVRQVRIKMKSHEVRIHGLVEEIEIRLEGQVESGVQQTEARISMDMAGIIDMKYEIEIRKQNPSDSDKDVM
ncbi:hypothetical protein EDD18DRAFT_1112332 [Armillaria luteobubalina]|uniref:Uncharacterized protein n=1 Tax=Armillaria luteobubalina TaxID=153913 RepID=A0AA39UDS5_9AGAR|nr:hypothetical protein EDD18DRAFT_1112332 [Armillaria luteobubalina]